MLAQADAPMVHAVMSSAAVFARMRGQQKGQVMDLLGQRGLHRSLQGEQQHLLVSICCFSFAVSDTCLRMYMHMRAVTRRCLLLTDVVLFKPSSLVVQLRIILGFSSDCLKQPYSVLL